MQADAVFDQPEAFRETVMDSDIAIFGYGAVGRATAQRLTERGSAVRVVQRSRPAGLPAGARFFGCDVFDAAAVRQAVDGVRQIVVAIGFPYFGEVWRRAWPVAMQNLL